MKTLIQSVTVVHHSSVNQPYRIQYYEFIKLFSSHDQAYIRQCKNLRQCLMKKIVSACKGVSSDWRSVYTLLAELNSLLLNNDVGGDNQPFEVKQRYTTTDAETHFVHCEGVETAWSMTLSAVGQPACLIITAGSQQQMSTVHFARYG